MERTQREWPKRSVDNIESQLILDDEQNKRGPSAVCCCCLGVRDLDLISAFALLAALFCLSSSLSG